MNRRNLFRKSVAWTLIAALANPAMMTPAFARDTDIFLSVSGGTTTAEPNVLLVLGTNDRMNIAEPWREYPGAYDSHVEYLWNDINIISNTLITSESPDPAIPGASRPPIPAKFRLRHSPPIRVASTAIGPARHRPRARRCGRLRGPMPWPPNRAIRAALYVAQLTTMRHGSTGSPPPNAPASPADQLATESDLRLLSPAFNRFRGYQKIFGGFRGNLLYTGTTTIRPTISAQLRSRS